MSTDPLKTQNDIESELQRSITIIVWHSHDTEPIRLRQSISTFPLFQLSRLPTLVTDLGFTPSTYLDTYNPQTSKWEQHTIASVRVVQSGEKLLYRIRRSLLTGLSEDECPGLKEELAAQALTSTSFRADSKKREAEYEHEDASPQKQFHVSKSLMEILGPDANAFYSSSNNTAPDTSPSNPRTVSQITPATPLASGAMVTLPSYLLLDRTASPVPYHPHPPLRRFPNDYTVSQITAGLYALEALCSHSLIISSPTTPDSLSPPKTVNGPNLTQKHAFERVFGSRYVKSTLCRHRGVWRNAPREIREEFERYGDDEKGIWGNFVKRVEGKALRGEDSGTISIPVATGGTTALHSQKKLHLEVPQVPSSPRPNSSGESMIVVRGHGLPSAAEENTNYSHALSKVLLATSAVGGLQPRHEEQTKGSQCQGNDVTKSLSTTYTSNPVLTA